MTIPEFRALCGEVAREGDWWVYTESFRIYDDETQELHDVVNDGIRDAREAIKEAGYEIDEKQTDSDHDSVWIYFREPVMTISKVRLSGETPPGFRHLPIPAASDNIDPEVITLPALQPPPYVQARLKVNDQLTWECEGNGPGRWFINDVEQFP